MIAKPRYDEKTRRCPNGLSSNKLYLVLAIEANSYRILDDTGDPILYDNDEVQIIDSEVPTTWTWEYGDEGEAYAGPNYLTKYVWEDYHDGIHKAVSIINEYVKSVGPCSWQASPDENE